MKNIITTKKKFIHFIELDKKTSKQKRVGDILKNLWLDVIWTWKNDLSINHDNLLYK